MLVPFRVIEFAYIPPIAETSKPILLELLIFCVSNVLASILFLPVRASIEFAQTPAFTFAASVKICNELASLALRPFLLIATIPRSTRYEFRFPDESYSGLPVVNTARSVLINPPPSTVIPLGFAITTEALRPATSINPFILVGLCEVTSLTMTLAEPRIILVLPGTYPPSLVLDIW